MLNYIKVSLQEINIFAAVTYGNVYFFRRQLKAAAFFIHIHLFMLKP